MLSGFLPRSVGRKPHVSSLLLYPQRHREQHGANLPRDAKNFH
ncbi:hypothetical protein [Devosia rhizoryzae]|nr:hypothetical protein [Devosia rhizoryzae]